MMSSAAVIPILYIGFVRAVERARRFPIVADSVAIVDRDLLQNRISLVKSIAEAPPDFMQHNPLHADTGAKPGRCDASWSVNSGPISAVASGMSAPGFFSARL